VEETQIFEIEVDMLQPNPLQPRGQILADSLVELAESIREQEVERALRRLGEVDPETAEQIELLSRALVKKLLHEPTVRLRERAGEGDADDVAAAVRELFGLSARRDP